MIKLTPKEWRKAKGFSIEKIAEILEVSPVTWSKWEDEPSKIPIGKADKFSEFIDVPIRNIDFYP